jgi:hypothetical protein
VIPPTVPNKYYLPLIVYLFTTEPVTATETALVVIAQDAVGARVNDVPMTFNRCMDDPVVEESCARWNDPVTMLTQFRFNENGIASLTITSYGWFRVIVGGETRTFFVPAGAEYHNEVFVVGARALATQAYPASGDDNVMLGVLVVFVVLLAIASWRARVE